jgi:acyl-CoA dehydrogenase
MKDIQDLTETLQGFVETRIQPRHHEMNDFVMSEKPGARPAMMNELQQEARAAGLWNMGLERLPEGVDGTPMSNSGFAPIAERLGRVYWSAEVFNCQAPDLPNMEMLQKVGTEAQQDRWLRPLLEGKTKSGFAMTEPQTASSDARNITCRIEDKGDHLVLNGHKWFVGNTGLDNWAFIVVIGQTDPEAAPNARHSAVIVPTDAEGLHVVREVPVIGFQHRFRPHGEVILKDVVVPRENLLGEKGAGFAAAQVRLATARIHHCMRTIGAAELMLSLMAERAQARTTFGKLLIERDKIQEFLALSRIEIDQARLLTMNAARVLDEKGSRGAQREISMIKLAVARAGFAVADRAVQVFGAMGLTNDSPVADFFTQMRALRIYDGPDEVHVRTISRHEIAHQKNAAPDGLLHLFCTDFSDRLAT